MSIINIQGMIQRRYFSLLEEQVAKICHNTMILMVSLERYFIPFEDFSNSNLKFSSNRKFGDNKDLEKEPNNKRPSSNVTSSQYLFKVEEKMDIKPYQCDIDVIYLNKW